MVLGQMGTSQTVLERSNRSWRTQGPAASIVGPMATCGPLTWTIIVASLSARPAASVRILLLRDMASYDFVTSKWFLWLNHLWNGVDVVGRHPSQFSFSAIESTAFNPAWLRDALSWSGSIWWVEVPRSLTVGLASERECLKNLAVGGTDVPD